MAIALVQQAVAKDDASGVSVSATIASSGAGRLLVCVVSWNTGATGSVVISDNLGQTWSKAASGSRSGAAGTRTEIWYRANTAAGVTSITATPSVALPKSVNVSEWSGVDTSVALRAGSNSTTGGTASPILTPSLTPLGSTSLAIGAWNLASGSITETLLTAGYTAMTDGGGTVSGNQNRPAYRIGVSGAQSVSWSLSAGANWGAALALFNAAALPGVGQPSVRVYLAGTQIPENENKGVVWGRGANFDGSSESPGTCVVTVSNRAGKYNPANGSSPIAASLKIGKELRVEADWGGITYGIFHGYIRRIIPIPGESPIAQTAELHAEDALWKFGRYEANLPFSSSLSFAAFRGAILDAIGEDPSRRLLSGSGPEADTMLAGADARAALDLLTELCLATGSIHFIDPDPDSAIGYRYHTVDRASLEGSAVSEAFDDTDLATIFATDLGGFDYTDEGVINSQRVRAHLRDLAPGTVLWDFGQYPYTVPAGGSGKDIWASWTDPATGIVESDDVGAGAVTLTPFFRTAKLHIFQAGADSTFQRLQLIGTAYPEISPTSELVEDLTSQAAYGVMAGSEIDTEFLTSRPPAAGLAAYIIWRYATPRAKPSLTITNRFPAILVREIGDRISLTSGLVSATAVPYFIRALAGSISEDGQEWKMVYQLEEAPAGLSLFTVGGTAAQGVGGTGILGY